MGASLVAIMVVFCVDFLTYKSGTNFCKVPSFLHTVGTETKSFHGGRMPFSLGLAFLFFFPVAFVPLGEWTT